MENVTEHDWIVGRGELDWNMEEDTSLTLSKPKDSHFSYTVKHGFSGGEKVGNRCNDEDDEECDSEAWETLSKGFKDVQSVLDQNRDLIRQVNENHQSKVPDNLVKNVSLIKEINGNISKVIGIYSDLSVNFSNIVQQRRATPRNSTGRCDSKLESTYSWRSSVKSYVMERSKIFIPKESLVSGQQDCGTAYDLIDWCPQTYLSCTFFLGSVIICWTLFSCDVVMY